MTPIFDFYNPLDCPSFHRNRFSVAFDIRLPPLSFSKSESPKRSVRHVIQNAKQMPGSLTRTQAFEPQSLIPKLENTRANRNKSNSPKPLRWKVSTQFKTTRLNPRILNPPRPRDSRQQKDWRYGQTDQFQFEQIRENWRKLIPVCSHIERAAESQTERERARERQGGPERVR